MGSWTFACWKFLISYLSSLLVISRQLNSQMSVSLEFNLSRLYVSGNVSFSFGLSSLLGCNCS